MKIKWKRRIHKKYKTINKLLRKLDFGLYYPSRAFPYFTVSDFKGDKDICDARSLTELIKFLKIYDKLKSFI
jgi:hypothetical protein